MQVNNFGAQCSLHLDVQELFSFQSFGASYLRKKGKAITYLLIPIKKSTASFYVSKFPPNAYRHLVRQFHRDTSLKLYSQPNFFRYANCQKFIMDYEDGRLQTQPGCTAEETLEVITILARVLMTNIVYTIDKQINSFY